MTTMRDILVGVNDTDVVLERLLGAVLFATITFKLFSSGMSSLMCVFFIFVKEGFSTETATMLAILALGFMKSLHVSQQILSQQEFLKSRRKKLVKCGQIKITLVLPCDRPGKTSGGSWSSRPWDGLSSGALRDPPFC